MEVEVPVAELSELGHGVEEVEVVLVVDEVLVLGHGVEADESRVLTADEMSLVS